MRSNQDHYNIAAIRSLLRDAFTAKDLWRFCQDRPTLQPVLTRFGYNSSLDDMSDVLIEYCQTQALFDELLAAVHESNPRQFERYQTLLHGGGPLPTRQIPDNLPPRSEFVGREKEKQRIHEALRSRYFLISIEGIGGIGKTSLVLEVAYECLHASRSADPPAGIVTFDSFVWASAKDRDLTLNAMLDAIAFTLDYPGIVQRPLDQKRVGVERLLREKSCLLIVDNLDTINDDQVPDFLRYLPEPSKALITTREQKLGHAWTIPLKGLVEVEALALIRSEGRRLGLTSIEEADDRTLLRLYEATGGAPLALKWAVGQIKQWGQSLDTVLAALHDARGSVFEEIFGRSWSLLSPDAQRVLTSMPVFAAPASREAIESASEVHLFALDEALRQLVEMSLTEAADELDPRRYSIHPLTRSFAASRLSAGPDFEQESRSRLAGYYVEVCNKRGQWGDVTGFPWFEVELPNIIAVIEWAFHAKRWDAVVSIFQNLYFFLGTAGYWKERIEYGQMVIEAAQNAGDRQALAICQHALGWILWRQRRYKDAEEPLQSSLEIFRDIGQNENTVRVMVTQAKLQVSEGRLQQARYTVNKARRVLGAATHESLAAGLLTVESRIEEQQGRLDKAWGLMLRALRSTEKAGDTDSVGSRQIDLGQIALADGRLDEAEKRFEAGLEISNVCHRKDNIAEAKLGLAAISARRGEKSGAMQLASEAYDQFTRMGLDREAEDAHALLHQLKGGEGNGE